MLKSFLVFKESQREQNYQKLPESVIFPGDLYEQIMEEYLTRKPYMTERDAKGFARRTVGGFITSLRKIGSPFIRDFVENPQDEKRKQKKVVYFTPEVLNFILEQRSYAQFRMTFCRRGEGNLKVGLEGFTSLMNVCRGFKKGSNGF